MELNAGLVSTGSFHRMARKFASRSDAGNCGLNERFQMAELAPFELVPAGPLRDALNADVLSGEKTATSRVIPLDEMAGISAEPVGTQLRLLDSDGAGIATVEITEIRELPLRLIDDEIAHAEGRERFPDAAAWRAAHERYWGRLTESIRTHLGDPEWAVTDDTIVRVRFFRMVSAD